jgi:hypothetical protein
MLTEFIDFDFVEKEGSELYSTRILRGEYSGVIFTYGSVRLREEDEQLRIQFQFKIEQVPEGSHPETFERNPKFKHFIGELLGQLLESSGGKIGKFPTIAE